MFDARKVTERGYATELASAAVVTQRQKVEGSITPGATFVEQSPFLPQTLRLESDTTRPGWARVADSMGGGQLERTLTAAGWNSFYIAGSIRTTVFGFDRQKMARTALRRVMANLKADKCNCVEIDEVTSSRYLGVPYVRVMAHARQLQVGKVLRSE